MPATLRLREESDQTAELQDLLSRLQTPEVDGEFGGMLDSVRRQTNSLRGINRKSIVELCNNLINEQKKTSAKLADETKQTLDQFISLLETKYDDNTKKAYIKKLGANWKILEAELNSYLTSPRHAVLDTASSKSHIEQIIKQMNAYKKGWTEEFK
jgi:hypothetical protein